MKVASFFSFYCLFLIFSSCQKDEIFSNSMLFGTWYASEHLKMDSTSYARAELSFKSDHTFEAKYVVIDSASRQILGYGGKTTGTYQLLEAKLQMNYKQFYYPKEGTQIAQLEELELNNVPPYTLTDNITLTEQKDSLTFWPSLVAPMKTALALKPMSNSFN